MSVHGYQEELFLSPVMDEFNCTICHMVMKDPVRCQDEHLFCRACIESWLLTSTSCPVDRKQIDPKTGVFVARMASTFIDKLKIRCPTTCSTGRLVEPEVEQASKKAKLSVDADISTVTNTTGCCSWTGLVGEVSEHLEKCDKVLSACCHADRGCTHLCIRSEMELHRLNDCAYTLMTCKLCTASYMRKDKASHTLSCSKWPTKCKNSSCDVVVPNDEIAEHVKICPMQLIPCPLRETIGCTASRTRKDMPNHAENAGVHMSLLVEKIASQDAIIKTHKSEMCELVKEVTAYKAKANHLEVELKDLSKMLKRQKVELPHWVTTYYMWKIHNFNINQSYATDEVNLGGYTGVFTLTPPSSKEGTAGHHGVFLQFTNSMPGAVRCDVKLCHYGTPKKHHTGNVLDRCGYGNKFIIGIPEFISTAALHTGEFVKGERNRMLIRFTVSIEADYYD
jgi:hypothetical protein